jgi:hypothetical protein
MRPSLLTGTIRASITSKNQFNVLELRANVSAVVENIHKIRVPEAEAQVSDQSSTRDTHGIARDTVRTLICNIREELRDIG